MLNTTGLLPEESGTLTISPTQGEHVADESCRYSRQCLVKAAARAGNDGDLKEATKAIIP
eukprot:26798-Hanusia_phi.AAC.1